MIKPSELRAMENKDTWTTAQYKLFDLEYLLGEITSWHARKGNLTSKGGTIKIPDSYFRKPEDIQTAKDYFQKNGWGVDNVGGPTDGTYEFDIKPIS